MSTAAAQATRTITPRRATRHHHVTAVVVSHDGAAWLPRVLTSLRAATRRPDRMVAVDTGSTDGSPTLLLDDPSFEVVVRTPDTTGFGAAVAGGLYVLAARDGSPERSTTDPGSETEDAAVPGPDADGAGADELAAPDEPAGVGTEQVIDLRDGQRRDRPDEVIDLRDRQVEWIWLLHDDSAVAPDALERLLAAADRRTEAVVLGPKLRAWRRPEVLLECGVSLTGTGRRETVVVAGEVDQGQHDGRTDVTAVSSAGMLVRRDVWDRLGGFSTAYPLLGDDIDFCWRVRRAGLAVAAVPDAVMFHRQAMTDRLREPTAGWGGLRRIHRKARVMAALVHAPTWRLPFTLARVTLGAFLRFLFHLFTLSPRRAWDDVAGCAAGVASWRQVARSRRELRTIAAVPAGELRHLRPSLAQRLIHWQESWARHHRSRSDAEARLTARAARLTRLAGLVAVVVAVVCLVATWTLWLGAGRLAGGALLPAPDGATDLVAWFLSPWHEVGLGSAVAAPPYLLLVAASAVPLFGSAAAAVQVLMLLGPVLCGLTAILALRGVATRPVTAAAAVAYALLPATVAASGTGRLGTMLAAILLPVTLRFLVRITGIDTPLPSPNRRTVVAAALLVAGIGSVVPALAVLLVALTAIVAVFSRHAAGAGRALVVAALAVALLWPWSGHVLSQPGLLLLEIGAQPPVLSETPVPVWSLALLDPGGPLAPQAGLAVALVGLAVVALLPSRTRRAVIVAWLVMLAGLFLGIGQAVTTVTVPSSPAPVQPWPGPATLLMGAGALAAIAIALTGIAGRGGRFGSRLLLVTALVAPALVAGWWVTSGDTMLQRREPGVVSPYVTSESLSPQAPRTLQLSSGPDGTVAYQIMSGAGPRLGDADVAPAADSVREFSQAVALLAAGGSPQALGELAQASVRFLSVDTRADRALARQLDAVPGVRRISTLDGQGLWELAAWQPRGRALTEAGPQELPVDTGGPALSVGGTLPAGATQIQLGETPGDVWRASVGDTQLEAAAGRWQTFTVPDGADGDVAVAVDRGARMADLTVPAVAALLLLALAAGPQLARRPVRPRRRRRRRPDEQESAGLEILERETVEREPLEQEVGR